MSQGSSENGSTVRNIPQPDESTISVIDSEKSRKTMSPTRSIQDKQELQILNNRLAAYIDRVKNLEMKNFKLTQKLNSLKEVTSSDLINIKGLLESENTDLRNALDQKEKEKIQLGLENRRSILKAKKLKKKLDQATNDLKKAIPYIAKIKKLNRKYAKTLIQNKNLKNARKELIKALRIEKKYSKDVSKKIKIKMLEKITAETQMLSMKKNFKSKEEFQNLENELLCLKKALKLKQEALSTTSARLDEITQKQNNLLATNNEYLEQLTALKRSTENIRIKYSSKIEALNQQLIVMQDDMSKKVQEYQDLLDFKKETDMEINTYRKLLESEERRLSITPNTSEVGSSIPKKVKLLQHDESPNVITASSTGDIEINEVCPDGQFIKLYNKGPKRVSLSGFELILTTAEQKNSTKLKFRRSIKLEAGNILTVWSATVSNQTHDPKAGSIVMKTQAWSVSKIMTTVLLNTKRQQIATHELKKECASHS